MAYRFTDTNKWTLDSWFISLTPFEKLLFIYIYENCDCAGFLELSDRKIMFDTGLDLSTIEGALKGLQRGFIYSNDKTIIFLKNFLKHQKNIPLNITNKAHLGIINRLNERLDAFGFDSYDLFFTHNNKGASKGLDSPTGIGIGNDIGLGNSFLLTFFKFPKDSKIYSDENEKAFNEFIKIRNDLIRMPFNQVVCESIYKQLLDLTDSKEIALKIIEQSIRNGYKDLFKLKEDFNNKSKNDNHEGKILCSCVYGDFWVTQAEIDRAEPNFYRPKNKHHA